jgi:small GTP-binding protein
MSLSIGIVGLPNVGKSTLFKALTKKEVLIANYPFATIDPNVGVVEVPDERLDKLSEFSKSAKKIPAIVEFVDIAGLVRGANKGEGLGNQFLANIREVDVVLYVVRAFEDPEIHHVEAVVDPKADIEILTTELMLKDLETIEKHLEKVKKQARGNDKEAVAELPILEKLKGSLADGFMACKVEGAEKVSKDLQLLTAKRGIFLFNVNVPGSDPVTLDSFGFPAISMNVCEELEGAGFSREERKDLGLSSSKLPELIRLAYETLGLITFFTAGEDETRAWTIKQGALAPEAAGVIHTDFQEKFIRAEIIQWQDLLAGGLWRTMGKDYIMKDGDVIEVKHGA